MPDPISSSYAPPDLTCDRDDALTCKPAVAPPPPPPSPNSCSGPEPQVEDTASDAARSLASHFLRIDHSALIAAATEAESSAESEGPTASGSDDQILISVGMQRRERHGSLGALHLTGALDLYNANFHLGSQNDDGSKGENFGLGYTSQGVEATAEYKGWSLTAGVAESIGFSISSGEARDIDGDGVRERCFKMSLGPFTLGECDEL